MSKRSKPKALDVLDVIELGVEVIMKELVKLKLASEADDEPIEASAANLLVKYVNACIAVAKDSRETDLQSDLNDMSDEELEALARDVAQNNPTTRTN